MIWKKGPLVFAFDYYEDMNLFQDMAEEHGLGSSWHVPQSLMIANILYAKELSPQSPIPVEWMLDTGWSMQNFKNEDLRKTIY